MEKQGLTQEDLATIMGRAQPTISEIMRGKRLISPEIAIDLEAALNGSVQADQLLQFQTAFQLNEARKENCGRNIRLKAKLHEEFPVAEMEKRGWITKTNDIAQSLKQVLAFANNSPDLDRISPPFHCPILARQSATLGYLSPSSRASRAWQYRVKELSEMTPVREFDHELFVNEGMKEIRSLAGSLRGVAQVPQTLAKYGIRFVIVQHLQNTKLDGAATWLDEEKGKAPVIALTLRYGTIDCFWFNLAHELQHICKRHAFSLNIDSLKGGEIADESLRSMEEEANREGADWLISQDRLNAFVQRLNGKISEQRILAFAEVVNVHPGILVGMLHHSKIIPYSRFVSLKVNIRKHALLGAMADGFKLPVVKRKTA